MIKKKFKISGMHCTSCAMNIDGELEDAGVKSANTSYAKQECEVQYDEKQLNESKIIEIIKTAGYTASSLS